MEYQNKMLIKNLNNFITKLIYLKKSINKNYFKTKNKKYQQDAPIYEMKANDYVEYGINKCTKYNGGSFRLTKPEDDNSFMKIPLYNVKPSKDIIEEPNI